MAEKAAIRFEGVSKKFVLHRERPRSFQEVMLNLLRRTGNGRREEFWALRDVSFVVGQGEAVGIIGPNGAGKSTALKLISRIISPTSGRVEINGKVGALLELGAGFHPDLTGRENVFLNGSILGLSRSYIQRKLDEIIAFAELERFIDIPVKHYSSGMYVRLGFSVAVHTNPEVLLVDEVLAVGDQNFQHKCLDRIFEMQQQGVTICLVSHGLGSVRQLCSHAIWLDDGIVRAAGGVEDTISAYLYHAAAEEGDRIRATSSGGEPEAESEQPWGGGDIEIVDVSLFDADGKEQSVFRVGEQWGVRLHYRAFKRVDNPVFELALHRNDRLYIGDLSTHLAGLHIPSVKGEGDVLCRVRHLPLMEGSYLLSATVRDQAGTATYDRHDCLYNFKVRQVRKGERYGVVSVGGEWNWNDKEHPPPGKPSLTKVKRVKEARKVMGGIERRWGTGDVEIVNVSFRDVDGRERRVFEAGEPWEVRLYYQAHRRIERPVFGLAICRDGTLQVCGPNTYFAGYDISFIEGEGGVSYYVDQFPLLEGSYCVSVAVHNQADTVMYDYHDRLYAFKVCQFEENEQHGLVSLKGEWEWSNGGVY
jgi:lipopolysaccharide transport system ATP-binding protein